MASIKISNLPSLMAASVSDNDYFIVNDENQTTSKLQFTQFVEALGNQDYTFSGAVNFTGSVSVNVVDDSNSNIYTKTSVNTLIAESEARDNVKILANATDINQLQNLLPAPTSGGLFLAGTFTGAADTATQVVTAINLVSDKVTADAAVVSNLSGFVNSIASDLALVTANVSTNTSEIALLKTAVGDVNSGLTLAVADNVAAIAALDARVTTDIANLAALDSVVSGLKTSLEDGGALKTEIESAQSDATAAGVAAAAAQTTADGNRTDTRGALANLSQGILDLASANPSLTANQLAAELIVLLDLELAAGGNLEA